MNSNALRDEWNSRTAQSMDRSIDRSTDQPLKSMVLLYRKQHLLQGQQDYQLLLLPVQIEKESESAKQSANESETRSP